MIRTLIEVTHESSGGHARDLRDVLDKLGFQPKDSADQVRFMDDLFREIADLGLEPHKMVEAQREKRAIK